MGRGVVIYILWSQRRLLLLWLHTHLLCCTVTSKICLFQGGWNSAGCKQAVENIKCEESRCRVGVDRYLWIWEILTRLLFTICLSLFSMLSSFVVQSRPHVYDPRDGEHCFLFGQV